MSKKANPAAIGAFVLVALFLAVAAVAVLGSGRFFRKSARHVIFFEGSLSGLDVGAPVEYRGVRIGQVADIVFQYDAATEAVQIPVYIDLEEDRFRDARGRQDDPAAAHRMLRKLRAQLDAQSLLTGKLKVMLVDRPDEPARLVGADPRTPEIAAIPTFIERFSENLERMPLSQIVSNLDVATMQIADFASSGELSALVAGARGALREIETLGRQLNEELPGLLATARQNGDRLLGVQSGLDELLREIRELLAGDSPERRQLRTLLRSSADAFESIRNLVDYLQLHPEALLSGKEEQP